MFDVKMWSGVHGAIIMKGILLELNKVEPRDNRPYVIVGFSFYYI